MKLSFDNLPAVLLGLAIGDAAGAPYEDITDEGRRNPKPAAWDGQFHASPDGTAAGAWTDDTQLAYALAEACCPSYIPARAAAAYLDVYRQGIRGIGGTIKGAMDKLSEGVPWYKAGHPTSGGNGSAMRVAPIGLRYADDPALAASMARIDSSITHASPVAQDCAAAVAAAVALLVGGIAPENLIDTLTDLLPWVGAKSFPYPGAPQDSPYVLTTLGYALVAVAGTHTFQDAIALAISFGGDTDTTAAITGAMAGARYGRKGIPAHLLAVDRHLDLFAMDEALFRWTGLCASSEEP